MCELCDANNGELLGCPDCGCMICFDVEDGDDILRPPYVTESGDLYCQRCGIKHDLAEHRIWDEEAAFLPDPFEMTLPQPAQGMDCEVTDAG